VADATSQAPQWPAHPNWQQFVMAPSVADVEPTSVVSTSGDVTNADHLADPGAAGDVTTLTMAAGAATPTHVVDYGKDIGGIPYFVVRSQAGSPVLRSSFSEGRQYIGPLGDNAPSNTSAGDSSRVDTFTVTGTGKLTNGLIQGGERYEEIALTSPGSVTLSSVGIRFSAVRATEHDYRGWFASSSPALNQIWYDGAYTTQLDELPADSLPGAWHVVDGALVNDQGLGGILAGGAEWGDYTTSFEAQVVDGQAGWMVRARSSLSAYVFFLDDDADATGPSDTLQEYSFSPRGQTLIAKVHLRAQITPGSWHQVTTVVHGSDITTSLDGHRASRFSLTSLPPGAPSYENGSVGFFEYPGQEARFRDLDVSGPGGMTLFSDRLGRSAALADFRGPDVTSSDLLPVVMDGAKRDREVWSGDLGVEGPNVFYTTDSDEYVKDSLELLGSYQSVDGESGAQVPPTSHLGSFPENGATYSVSYSMDEVVNIASYYLYTGDLAFVRAEWPMITRELAYNRSLLDRHGLLATDSENGRDWDYYDGSKTGEVTAYNDIYYETLVDAASLAHDLGRRNQAADYRHEASALRSVINRYLWDPVTKLYALSNLVPDGVAQDANALAVLDGVADRGQDGSILSGLQKTLPTTPYGPLPFTATTGFMTAVSPFVTNEEVQADFVAGDTPTALSLLETLWGYMDSPGPDFSGADWELVGADGSPGFGSYTSLAHGWSSGPTADLSGYVLGVQPVSPGYRTWLVQPHPGTLSWVEGDVPTPHGTIAVRWAQQDTSGRFVLQLRAPPHTRGTVSVPVPASGATVTVRSSPQGNAIRALRTPRGLAYQPLHLDGGRTYLVDVVPLLPAPH
jgi:alpha-L-rhamnosidase